MPSHSTPFCGKVSSSIVSIVVWGGSVGGYEFCLPGVDVSAIFVLSVVGSVVVVGGAMMGTS